MAENGHNGTMGRDGRDAYTTDPTKLTQEAVDRSESRIRELYDLRFEQLDLRLEQRFQAQSKSLDAALIAADLKSNALQDKINQNALDNKGNITRIEYDSAHKALLDKISTLQDNYYEARGVSTGSDVAQKLRDLSNQISDLKQSRDVNYGTSTASPTTNEQISRIERKVDSLGTSRDTSVGKTTGLATGWQVMIGAVALISTIVAIVLSLR